MSTVTVVPTVEASNLPPRVRLDVTDTGTSPSLFSAVVVRINPDGSKTTVRTGDGGPLVLSTSGSNRIGFVYDYEMPLGAPVTYSTMVSPSVVSSPVTVASSQVWLVHPGVPSLSIPIDFRAGSFETETLSVQRTILRPMGRKNAVVLTSGARSGPDSSMIVGLNTLSDVAGMKAILADANTLLLNPPADLGLGIEQNYIAVDDVPIKRLTDIGSDPHRDVVLPFVVVDRPAGGSASGRTLGTVEAQYATLAAAQAAYATLYLAEIGP